MSLVSLLCGRAPNRVFLSMLCGALAGVGHTLLIPVVLSGALDSGVAAANDATYTFWSIDIANHRFAAAFVCICVFIVGMRSTSQILLSTAALDATAQLRTTVYERVASAPIAQLESIGSAKVTAAVTTDVQAIVAGATTVPGLLASMVTLTGVLLYLAVLNAAAAGWVVAAILVGAVTYQLPVIVARKSFERRRAAIDRLYESIRGLIHGAKELKLGIDKREQFIEGTLRAGELAVLKSGKQGYTTLALALSYGDMLNFLVIGVMAFVFVNYHEIAAAQLIGVVMALLFIAGPVSVILNSITPMALAGVSLRNLQRLLAALQEESRSRELPSVIGEWDAVRLAGVSYTYAAAGASFTVGPVDLELRKGEITFIVGGNGSGKSTLCRTIALLYRPTQGEIRFGALRVDEQSLAGCRRDVAAIFTDYHLFDRLLRVVEERDLELANAYLAALQLDSKVSFDRQGRVSTLALSDGQKKRLALLVAILEDRSLYLFDEWAADQDPQFKDVFYHTVLPALKARGKAVVAITHDDRYFAVADKVVVMNEGRIVGVERQSGAGGVDRARLVPELAVLAGADARIAG